jgi:secretion/DNA translocation related CpaE-like protein
MPTCLLLTADPVRREELHRLAATAAVDLEVVSAVDRVRPSWSGAGLVLVGADLLAGAGAAGLARRAGVIVLGDDLDDPSIWRAAVEVGAEHVVFLPDAESWLLHRLAETAEAAGPPARLVAVVGGCGGAGASTLAAGLAHSAVRAGRTAVLLDGDPRGGGLDLLLGVEDASGVRWSELAGTHGRLPAHTLRQALPSCGELPVVSYERRSGAVVPEEAVRAVLDALRRAAEVVVADVPRAADGVWRDLLREADHVLLVSRAEVRAAAATSVVAAELSGTTRDLRLVVREAGDLAAAELARALGLPLAARLREDAALRRALERGGGFELSLRSSLGRACRDLLEDLLEPGVQGARGAGWAA